MGNCNFKQTICDANASGREHSFAPQNIYCNALFNSKEVQNVEGGQDGRSMIEMLGVLAIIGVLSVGGIAGYSKAMMKYRVNKAIEQITLIAGNVRTFFASQRSYDGLTNTVIKKAKLVPDEMLTLDSDGNITNITNAFGGAVYISDYWGSNGSKTVTGYKITLYGLPQEACIELATHDWSVSDLIALAINEDDSAVMFDCVTGDYWDDDNVGCIYNKTLPMSVDKAASTCSDEAGLHFYFR